MRPSAHEKKPGTWEAKGLGRDGRRKSFYGRTPEEASAKARESFESWKIGPADQETLYGYYAEVFCPSVRHFADGTKRVYAAAFDGTWIPMLGDRPLREVSRSDVQRITNRLATEKASGTVCQYVSKLSALFDLAVADGVVASNPCSGVRTPKVRSKRTQPLTVAELRSLLESTQGGLRNAVILMGFFGLRVGEACGLMRQDFRGDCFQVSRQWPNLPLKTASSERTLPIPPECTFEPAQGLYLVGMAPSAVSYRLPVRPHRLRHTFNSVLEWDLDCPRMVTTALMGHRGDIGEVYSHAKIEPLRKWLSRFWEHVCTESTTKSTTFPQTQANL
jgi:integrase